MNDETLDLRFERDLRAALAASEPADVPATLYAFVDAIPRPAPRVIAPPAQRWNRRALAALAAAAVLAIIAVGIGSGIVRLPGILPQVAAPSMHTYRLYYEVAPLDRHTPKADELDRATEVLKARAAVYQGTATGYSGTPNTIAVDVVVPADDPGRLAEIRDVLLGTGGVIIGTMSDGPIEIGANTDGRAFEPAYGNGIAFTPTLRADGSALVLAIAPGTARPFSDWASNYPGGTGVVTTSDGVVVALAPIVAPGEGLTWTILFTPDQVAAGVPRQLLALFSAGTLPDPVREVAPRGEQLAPGITPEPEPTPSPTVAPGNELHVEYQVQDKALADETLAILERRLASMGITTFDRSITSDGRILLDLPVTRDDDAATHPVRQLLVASGKLDFVPLGQEPVEDGDSVNLAAHPELISSDGVTDVSVAHDQTGARAIQITFSSEAATSLATWTSAHVGEYLAIVFDGTAVAVPIITSPITDGIVLISGPTAGGWTEGEAQRLVAVLGSGELPTPITEVASNVVEPPPTASPTAAPTSLSVAGYAANCPSANGCTYALELRSADTQWQAALAIDVQGQATAGEGLPATLDPGDYTVTATAHSTPDSVGGGIGDAGPVIASCTANFTVAAGGDLLVVSATFGASDCSVSGDIPQ